MQKQTVIGFGSSPFGEAALAASRKVWLAGLGATAVTRDWVESEGGHFFRTLVKQGTVVESRAIRYLGDQVETSLTRANTMWRNTRRTVEATVKQAATTMVDYALDYAQQVLPKSLPKIELPKAFAPAAKVKAPAKRARKSAKAHVTRVAKKGKRTTKRV